MRSIPLGLAAVALIACGSDAPARSDYRAIVNDRCARLMGRTLDLADEYFADAEGPPTEQELREYTEEAVTIQRAALEDLRDRPAPEGDEDEVEGLFDAWGTALDAAAEDIESPEAREAADEFRQRAEDYGLTECAGL